MKGHSLLSIAQGGEPFHHRERDKSIKPIFELHGSMVYDQRIYSFKGVDRVSLLTLRGRIIVPILVWPLSGC